eukprot:TRINITY_DN545_c0_g1_i1.p1 TRINITY_DN545_c0_g1~~TRINITY_DN545_c0_g1_i1.p1  ORF type:complete len:548 (+),score=103.97 TRINITY_DN545_c0_g1_i1:151-1794(+)
MAVVDDPVGEVLSRFLVQAMIILFIVRVLGRLLAKVHQPRVIGEIIAGIILGPSVLGYVPGFSDRIFPKESLPYLALVAQIGLIFFMFLLGMEVDRKLMKQSFKNSIAIALSSIITPLAVGIGMAKWLYLEKIDVIDDHHYIGFMLFVGTAISFTAFPVLARILASAHMQHTELGVKMLAVAAIDDALGWCTLALVLAYSNGGSVVDGVYTALITIGFVLFCAFIMRRVISRIHGRLVKRKDATNQDFIGVMFIMLCLCSWFCEIFHVHAFFGAFVFGIIMPRKGWVEEDVTASHHQFSRHISWVEHVCPKLELVVVEFFLPLYFANSGLRTQLNTLDTGKMWGIVVAVLLIATACKFVPVALVSRCFKYSWRESITLGALMNTRGLVALIVLNIGLDKGVLGPRIFSILVVVALLTTLASPPALYFLLLRHQEKKQSTGHADEPVADCVLPIDTQTPAAGSAAATPPYSPIAAPLYTGLPAKTLDESTPSFETRDPLQHSPTRGENDGHDDELARQRGWGANQSHSSSAYIPMQHVNVEVKIDDAH